MISCAHNRVWSDTDITAHAEVTGIRQACGALGAVELEGCTIYSTTEPCPMCFAAIHWAKIGRIVFGTRIADAQRFGFCELTISNERMRELGGSGVTLTGDVLREENLAVFAEWAARPDARAY